MEKDNNAMSEMEAYMLSVQESIQEKDYPVNLIYDIFAGPIIVDSSPEAIEKLNETLNKIYGYLSQEEVKVLMGLYRDKKTVQQLKEELNMSLKDMRAHMAHFLRTLRHPSSSKLLTFVVTYPNEGFLLLVL